MLYAKLAMLAALTVGTGAVPLEYKKTIVAKAIPQADASLPSDVSDDPAAMPGGATKTTLSVALETEIKSFITAGLNGILAKYPCAAGTTNFTVSSLSGVSNGVDQGNLDYYQVTAVTDKGSVDMRLDVVTGSSPVTITKAKDFSTFDIFPSCIKLALEEEKAALATTQTPSSASEAAAYQAALSESAAKGADEAGHTDAAQVAEMKRLNMMAKMNKGKKKASLVAHNTSMFHNGYGLGHIQDEAALRKHHVNLIDPSTPSPPPAADYTPFSGDSATCLTNLPARDQGSCGSCWSFASSSAFSLNYCKYVYDQGYSTADTNIPTMTPQNMVTCPKEFGSDQGGGLSGCNGGTGNSAFGYIQKYGITSIACLPYVSGSTSSTTGGVVNPSGSSSGSTDAAQDDSASGCYSECTDSYQALHPASPMKFISGETGSTAVSSFTGEANIMAAIQTHGALYIAFDVYSTFTKPEDWDENIYRKPSTGLGTNRGGHAVVVYGWGTSTNGVKYWKLINSWGAWGITGTHGHFYMERGVNLCRIETMGAWTVALDTTDVHLGPPSNQFSCEDSTLYTGTTIATSTVADLNACKSACYNNAACGAFTFESAPTPAPTPAPTAAPTAACTDDSTWSAFGSGTYNCAFFAGKCTYYKDYGQRTYCPVSCGTCPAAPPPSSSSPPPPPPGSCYLKSAKGTSSTMTGSESCTITRQSPPPASPPPPSPSPGLPPASPGSTADVCTDMTGGTCLRSGGAKLTCAQIAASYTSYCTTSCVAESCPVTCATVVPTACATVCADDAQSCLSTSSGTLTCAQAKGYCTTYSCLPSTCPTTCGGGGSYGTCTSPASAGKAKLLELFGKVAQSKIKADNTKAPRAVKEFIDID